MGVILQAVYKQPNGHSVPSPFDGNRRTPFWWDRLAAQANSFRQAGFTAIWLPPVTKTNAGAFPGARSCDRARVTHLIARVATFPHRIQDSREVVGLRSLQRRELLVRIEFLLPEQLTDREHVPVIKKGGEWAAECAP